MSPTPSLIWVSTDQVIRELKVSTGPQEVTGGGLAGSCKTHSLEYRQTGKFAHNYGSFLINSDGLESAAQPLLFRKPRRTLLKGTIFNATRVYFALPLA